MTYSATHINAAGCIFHTSLPCWENARDWLRCVMLSSGTDGDRESLRVSPKECDFISEGASGCFSLHLETTPRVLADAEVC